MASRPTRKKLNDLESLGTHGCSTGKVGHLSKSAAFETAEWMMQLGRVNPGCHLTPAECDECGLWHVINRRIVPLSICAKYAGGLTDALH